MVKAVIGDENQLKLAEDRLTRSALPSQVPKWFESIYIIIILFVWIEVQFECFVFEFFLLCVHLICQIGLVIGKLSSKLDRGFVYDLVPTPPNDAGEPPCSVIDGGGESNKNKKKSSSKAKSQSESSYLLIDKDWVSEHARQVRICELKRYTVHSFVAQSCRYLCS